MQSIIRIVTSALLVSLIGSVSFAHAQDATDPVDPVIEPVIVETTSVETTPPPAPTGVRPPPPPPRPRPVLQGVQKPGMTGANTGTTSGTQRPPRPLDLMRQQKQQINQNAQGARRDLRQDTMIQLKNASTSGEKRGIIKEWAGERKDIMQARQASTTALRKNVQNALKQHGGIIRERFANAMKHLRSVSERIETRIEKLESAGVDTSSVEALFATAKTAITTAEADIAAVKAFVDAGVPEGSDPQAVRQELKKLIDEAQASIREAHKALRATVEALMKLAKETRPKPPTATTTSSSGTTE